MASVVFFFAEQPLCKICFPVSFSTMLTQAVLPPRSRLYLSPPKNPSGFISLGRHLPLQLATFHLPRTTSHLLFSAIFFLSVLLRGLGCQYSVLPSLVGATPNLDSNLPLLHKGSSLSQISLTSHGWRCGHRSVFPMKKEYLQVPSPRQIGRGSRSSRSVVCAFGK